MKKTNPDFNRAALFLVAGLMTSISTAALADREHFKHESHSLKHNQIEYGKVIDVTPVYREVKVTTPVKECWQEPVTHTRPVRNGANSAGGTLAGGLIGGIIGHQFGNGRGKKLATAVGTIVGAQLGHDAAKGSHASSYGSYTAYESFCEVENRVSYVEELDSYRVTYRYKGNKYQTNLPYDPGKKIKLRVTVEPVI